MFIEKVLKWQNIIVVSIIVLFACYMFFAGDYEETKILNSYEIGQVYPIVVQLPDESRLIKGEYPLTFDFVEGETCVVKGTLPAYYNPGFAIMTYSNYSRVRIYAGDELIGSYGEKMPLSFGRLIGNIRVLAEVPKGHESDVLRIEYTPMYTGKMSYVSIDKGNINALKLDVIYDNLWRLFFSLILFTEAFICIGISFFHNTKKLPTNNWTFYHLGCFLVYCAIWLVFSSDIPQLVTNANEVISFISFISLIIMPIHYAAFSTEVLRGTRKYFSAIQFVAWFIPLIEIFGMVTNLFDPPQLLVITHLAIGITCLVVFIFTVVKSREDVIARRYGNANIILIIFVLIALYMFYKFQSTGLDAFVLGFGIITFSLILFFVVMSLEFDYIKNLQTMEIYKELAYKDIMTDISNRTAFNERLSALDLDKESGDEVTMLILDINKLKLTNDLKGHEMGDKLICGAAEAIKKAFNKVGDCYRIGGDEFAVILINAKNSVDEYLNNLDLCIGGFNARNPGLDLSVSVGVASGVNDSNKFTTNLFKEADDNMYKDKEEWHKLLSKNVN